MVHTASKRRSLIGVVGGMGPLASAEFLKTIYECCITNYEQESPMVTLYSDPTFPDRTESFLAGSVDPLLNQLTEAVQLLCDIGASKIVICCFTMHFLVPRLPAHLRNRVWSLIDVALANVIRSDKKHLLICSTGTRKLKLFENHEIWDAAKELIVLPDDSDQDSIHKLIYKIKVNHDLSELIGPFRSLLSKYLINSFLVGCTEVHLLAKRLVVPDRELNGNGCIDPLAIIAKELSKEIK